MLADAIKALWDLFGLIGSSPTCTILLQLMLASPGALCDCGVESGGGSRVRAAVLSPSSRSQRRIAWWLLAGPKGCLGDGALYDSLGVLTSMKITTYLPPKKRPSGPRGPEEPESSGTSSLRGRYVVVTILRCGAGFIYYECKNVG
jgi:hypothetical protein